jgi:Tfp pilus assembly protein PilF
MSMKSTSKELEAFRARLNDAEASMRREDWAAALSALDAAAAIDPLQPKPLDLRAQVFDRLHREEEADRQRALAKTLRHEQWKRQVEAEIRGQHELMGGPSRHEIP